MVQACTEVAGERATLDTQLSESEARSAANANKLEEYKGRLKRAENAKAKAEAARKTLEAELAETRSALDAERGLVGDILKVARNFKDTMLEHLQEVRAKAARDFISSDSHRYLADIEYDVARQHGFDTAIKQLTKKKFISGDLELKKEGIGAFKNPDGTEFLPDPLPTEQLMRDEFCHIVAPEDEKYKYNHGGPYLPNFVPKVLMSHCMVPLEDYEEHNRAWLALP